MKKESKKTEDKQWSDIQNNIIVLYNDGKSELVEKALIKKNGIIIGYLNDDLVFIETGFIPMDNIKSIRFGEKNRSKGKENQL
jgi:hypothetical protein